MNILELEGAESFLAMETARIVLRRSISEKFAKTKFGRMGVTISNMTVLLELAKDPGRMASEYEENISLGAVGYHVRRMRDFGFLVIAYGSGLRGRSRELLYLSPAGKEAARAFANIVKEQMTRPRLVQLVRSNAG